MDLTKYYELKHQPNNLRLLTDSFGAVEFDDRLALAPPTCSTSSLPLRATPRLSVASVDDSSDTMLPHHFLDGAPPKTAVISGPDGRQSDHHLEELYKERSADALASMTRWRPVTHLELIRKTSRSLKHRKTSHFKTFNKSSKTFHS